MIYKYYDEGTLQPVTDRTLKFATVPDLNDPFENLGRPKLSTSNFEKQLSRTEKQLRELDISQKLPEKQRQAIVKKVINNDTRTI